MISRATMNLRTAVIELDVGPTSNAFRSGTSEILIRPLNGSGIANLASSRMLMTTRPALRSGSTP